MMIPLNLGKPLPKAGFGKGDFYAEPLPRVAVHPPSRCWHAREVVLEQMWLHGWA